MALAALIGAYQEVADGDALRATLPIAGHVLVEHQARQAAQAGAESIILLVERVPAPLTAAIDRLRRSGLRVEVSRSVADAADRIHPDERLLVVADGLLAEQRLVDRIASASAPAVLALAEEPRHAVFERIDATTRWGGLLLTDGTRLRRTVAMLGEWDLLSTLLRRTLQEDAARIEASAGVSLVDRADVVEAVRETLLDATRSQSPRWPQRFVFAPLEELAVPPLLRAGIDPVSVRALAIALTLIAALALAFGWRGTGLGAALLALPLDAVARRLGRLRLDPAHSLRLADWVQTAARGLALAALAVALARTDGWGVWPIAAALGGGLAALEIERGIARASGLAPVLPVWLSDEEASLLLLLPFALVGHWTLGLAAAAAYAAGSLFVVQARERRAAMRIGSAV